MKGKKLLYFISFVLFTTIAIHSSDEYNYTSPQGEEYLAYASSMPAPVGGLPAIYKKITYPKMAQQAGVEGKVYLIAFVNKNGSVDDVKVIKKLGAGCDEAAIKAVKATEFTPGASEGNPVNVKLSLQIQFKLK
ncbi:MAG: energy transducer TonB [Ignavibacteriae bacterium]|nr:energy transducer TonB [Ignavibacteriota bacterium]